MQSFDLHDKVVFHDRDPYAEPLFVDPGGRDVGRQRHRGYREHLPTHAGGRTP